MRYCLFVFFTSVVLCPFLLAQSVPQRSVLVLSGGGAKGLAHIGVLKGLEEIDFPIHEIIGTSMGSVVGALYAMGYSANEIETIVEKQNWTEMLLGVTGFTSQLSESQNESEYFIRIPLNPSSEVPSGFLRNARIDRLMRELFSVADTLQDFNKMRIPFSCFATDMEDGSAKWFKSGNLYESIRASIAIPGVFSPQKIGEKLYFDGGVSRNLPVLEAKLSDKNAVVAIDVGWEPQPLANVRTFTDMMNQAVGFWVQKSSAHDREIADILLQPNVVGYNSFSFSEAKTLIQRGYEAFLQNKAALLLLKSQLNAANPLYAPLKNKFLEFDRLTIEIQKPYHTHINTEMLTDLIRYRFNSIKGKITPENLTKIIEQLILTRYFTEIDYRMHNQNGDKILHITASPTQTNDLFINTWFDAVNSIGVGVRSKNERFISGTPVQFLLDASYQRGWQAQAQISLLLEGNPQVTLSAPFSGGIWQTRDTLGIGKIPYFKQEFRFNWIFQPKWFLYAGIGFFQWQEPYLHFFDKWQNTSNINGGISRTVSGKVEQPFNQAGRFYNLNGTLGIRKENEASLYAQVFGRYKGIKKTTPLRSFFQELKIGKSWGNLPLPQHFFLTEYGARDLAPIQQSEFWGNGTTFAHKNLIQYSVGYQEQLPYRFQLQIQANVAHLSETTLLHQLSFANLQKGIGLSLGYPLSLFGTIQGSVMTDGNRIRFGFSAGKKM